MPQGNSPALGADLADRSHSDDAYQWHLLVPGPERIKFVSESPDRVLLTGRQPKYQPIYAWNRRQVFTRRSTEPSTNQTACATWASESEAFMQQGLAVRVLRGPGDRQRAVTLTKNTFTYYYWVFNLLTWDTRRSGDPFKYVAQFDMSGVVRPDGELAPLPWRTCLRVHGTTVRFKVWLPDQEPEPGWHDTTHARRATLPGRFVLSGQPGWYIGHLRDGQTTEYADMVG